MLKTVICLLQKINLILLELILAFELSSLFLKLFLLMKVKFWPHSKLDVLFFEIFYVIGLLNILSEWGCLTWILRVWTSKSLSIMDVFRTRTACEVSAHWVITISWVLVLCLSLLIISVLHIIQTLFITCGHIISLVWVLSS